jgi:hypothetical protein
MVLHLLALPAGEDMPGARSGAYRRAFAEEWLRAHPTTTVATWDRGDEGSHVPVGAAVDEELAAHLRSLGYLE